VHGKQGVLLAARRRCAGGEHRGIARTAKQVDRRTEPARLERGDGGGTIRT